MANAIGAAIAQVGGEVDKVYAIEPGRREEALDAVRAEAIDKAIAAGATPRSVQIVDFDEVPIAYLPGNATRIRVKAVGDLDMGGLTMSWTITADMIAGSPAAPPCSAPAAAATRTSARCSPSRPCANTATSPSSRSTRCPTTRSC